MKYMLFDLSDQYYTYKALPLQGGFAMGHMNRPLPSPHPASPKFLLSQSSLIWYNMLVDGDF